MALRENRARHRWSAVLGTVALGLGMGVAVAMPAQAATSDVDGVELRWGLNTEANSGAYFGGCNFLSAGKAGNTGSSRVWTEADGFYSGQVGNVSVVKDTPSGSAVATWATKCQTATGSTVAVGGTTSSVGVFAAGTGTVDTAAGTASIAWDGDLTVSFYGGMTYWTLSDPILTVADGSGQLTATATGYGTSMEDQSQWVELAPEQIVLADLSDVTVDADGFVSTPDYLGVEVTPASGEQTRTGENWGAFPQSFVDFQAKTGQSSYWYSSGGAADPRKVTTPLSVSWTVDEGTEPGTGTGTGEDIDLGVTIPEDTDPGTPGDGELTWTVQNPDTRVNLGTAQATASAFVASGTLNRVTVSDTRTTVGAWTVNGSAGAFSSAGATFPGSALGWAPALVDNTVGAVAGPAVSAGSGSGLSAASTLVSAADGHTAGSVSVDAALQLSVPRDTAAGDYTGVLTLTLVG
ncbi:HtaA domain-containing protein [Cellulomonas sp. RIT-PI-Y]|uniref:HtaA domain-containing protein n=1 Tax=Cellulomonas sp. RIT-PI-Y TaxID=3035297 RepID=UPI0021D8CBC7|nr:HtaA domain-containing protein [Cellulomonas sp. RIT-PI-Y]